MRKYLFLLLALLAVSTAGNAQIDYLSIGYCDGRVSNTVQKEFCSSEKDVWVSGAIWLPASDINVCAGNELKAIRAGLAQKISIDTMCVWVRESLDGDNLAEGGIPKSAIQKGWNEIPLTSPILFDGNNTKGWYIGYSYHQTSINQGLAVLLEPTPHALYVKHGDGEWANRSDEGLLCVEGMVYGDNLPKLNLRLYSIDAPEYYILDRGKMMVSGVVKNLGVQTVTGFDVEARIDGVDEVYTAHVDTTLAYQDAQMFTFEISPAIQGVGKGAITVTISKLNEGDDLNMVDNVATDEFEIVQHDYTRMVLIEEFTTERCSNCPRVAGFIHDLLEKEAYKDVVMAVCHHAGFYTDWLTAPCDNSYLWYYNDGGSTYAPAVMIDRWTREGYDTPVFNPGSYEQLQALVDSRLAHAALVSIKLTAEVNEETNQLKVTATGNRLKEDFTVNPARITVFLVENNIKHHNQSGATGEFIHQHVTRKVNSDWGEVIEWNGNDYTYECTFDLRADYVRDNLQLIAMIYDYDEDASKNETANVGTLYYADFTNTGISNITTKDAPETIYDLSGRRVEHPTKGIYIVNGKKMVME